MQLDSNLQLVTFLLFVILVFMAFLTLNTVRKIHTLTNRVRDDVNATRKESKAVFGQLQHLALLEAKLCLPTPLPPLRGWAGSPDFLLTITDMARSRRPRTVVECGSGASTVVVARCLQMNGEGHVYSLEHDPEYAAKTFELLRQYGVADWATVLHAPLVRAGGESPWYDDTVIPSDTGPIDLLIVDGPPASLAPLVRLPALPKLMPRLAKSAVVILDDADREAEREAVRRWTATYPSEFTVKFLNHEKGCAVLERQVGVST